MNEVSIQYVLSEIREHPDRTFVIQFVRSTTGKGGKKGSIKTVSKARYGRSTTTLSTTTRPKKISLHISSGTLPMTDSETEQYFTPLISHIIGYNGRKVRH